MKKFLIAVAGLLLVVTASSCKDDEQYDRIETMTVASKTKTVYNPVSGLPFQSVCVKIEGEPGWCALYDDKIEGFVFEEGYECVVRVGVILIPDPPMDASDLRYKLLKVLSRVKKDSEGL